MDDTSALWIDAICIDQDNVNERIDQVAQLRNIYARATTIAKWVEPADIEPATGLLISKKGCDGEAVIEEHASPSQPFLEIRWGNSEPGATYQNSRVRMEEDQSMARQGELDRSGEKQTTRGKLRRPAWRSHSATPREVRMAFREKDTTDSSKLAHSIWRCGFIADHRLSNLQSHLTSPRNAFKNLRDNVHQNRHLKLAYAVFLTGAQLACIIPLQGFDSDHDRSHVLQQQSSTGDPFPPLLEQLDPDLNFFPHSSTTLFVFSALAYGAVAMHQYSTNDSDRCQQLLLLVGIMVGVWTSLSALAELGTQRVESSKLALSITAALLLSAVGHWAYAICIAEKGCENRDVGEEHKVEAADEVV